MNNVAEVVSVGLAVIVELVVVTIDICVLVPVFVVRMLPISIAALGD